MAKRNYSDAEVLEAIRKRSEKWDRVMADFYDSYFSTTRKYVLSKGGNESDAKDIFQDTILSFRNAVLDGTFDSGRAIKQYINAVIRNRWNSILKRNYRYTDVDQIPEKDSSDHPDDLLIRKESSNVIERIFSKIGKKCADLMLLRIRYNMKLAAIAVEMELPSEDAAKMKYSRCKKELKNLLEDNPELLAQLKGL